ncbi:MAG: hypothetical protein IPN61_18155 [Bacteroidetes bacterium]|nr:hypothetical protein [Bacteroidota bacterium]
MEFLERVFKLLNNNSKFPKYQLERRVDIFINIFLEDILTNYFNDGSKVNYICPEFPFKKDGNRQSTNVDYLCSKESDGNKEIIFVELKTDKRSFDSSQLEIYLKNKNWNELFENIRKLGETKGYREKYMLLINQLEENNFLASSKIRIVYISPLKIIGNIEAKGHSIYEGNVRTLADLLLLTTSFREEANSIIEFVKSWDLGVFEIRN